MSQKSILEQALLQVQTLEEAVKQNAKGILASTMKQELNDLLKESEDEGNNESPEVEEQDVPEIGDEETPTDDEESDEIADEPESDEEGEDEMGTDDEEEIPADDEEMPADDEMGVEDEMGADDEEGEDVLDMTSASDAEVLKVFRAMKPDDGIVVKKEGDKISLNVDDEEYIIKLGDEGMGLNEDWNESNVDTSMLEDDDIEPSDEDGTVFEIELDEEEKDVIEPVEGEVKKVEATEAARTKTNRHGDKNDQNRTGLPAKNVYKAGTVTNEEVSTLKKQVQVLREKNEEYKKALVLFKEKLNEVATFNANLAFATKLFTEHSTTKQEKMNILKRFDSVSTIKESKNLYSTINSELDNKKPMTEAIVDKITSNPTTSSTEVLSESKAYENPQFRRMKDLMNKIK
jgi:hypothetical protein